MSDPNATARKDNKMANGNGRTAKTVTIVLGIIGAIVTSVSLTYGAVQGRSNEKLETIKAEFGLFKTDYEMFRRDDAKLKGMIVERLDTVADLLKAHIRVRP